MSTKTLALIILLMFLYLALSEALSKSKCKTPFPSITISTNNSFYNSIFDKRKRVSIRYGDLIEVSCSGRVTRLGMTKDGENVLTENKNTSIFAMIKPDRPISKFVCSDSKTDCQRSVIISISQVIKVVSGNKEIDKKDRTFTIHYGSSFEVICAGLGRFFMTKNEQRLLIEQNGTTVKWFERKPELQSSEFVCTEIDTSFNTSVIIKVTPLMSVRTGDETVKVKYLKVDTPVYPVTYGDDFEVFCFGKTDKHILAENKEITEYINETTSKGFIAKFDKTELILICTGESDYVSTIKVVTKPRIDVTSSNMRIGKQYIVKYGERVDIFCTAATSKNLILAHHHAYSNVKKLTSITVNDTTIKYVIDKPEILVNLGHNLYACLMGGKVLARAEIELLPEAENFRCVSYYRRYINCTWIVINHISNMTLSYIENGIAIRICVQNLIEPGLVFYVWHKDQYPAGLNYHTAEFTFVLQSCNYFGCFNQTFLVDHLSIIKIRAPRRLIVNSTSHRAVKLRWSKTFVDFRRESYTTSNGGIAHKVEYWYSGIQPLEANSSLITCIDSFYCGIELKLPCPGQFYEVWIYQKLASVGDEFWSDPSHVTFYTDNDETHIVDEVCTQKPRKTKEVMIYFVQELREHVRLELQQLREIKSLKDKRDKIRAYLDRD